jgi:hypothetical protein
MKVVLPEPVLPPTTMVWCLRTAKRKNRVANAYLQGRRACARRRRPASESPADDRGALEQAALEVVEVVDHLEGLRT